MRRTERGRGRRARRRSRSCGASGGRWRRCARSRPSQKSGGVLRERVALRCAVIARHRGEFPVRLMCRVREVSVAGFYAHCRRPESWRTVIDDVLMAQVRIAFQDSGETYGAPRVHQELRAAACRRAPNASPGCCGRPGWRRARKRAVASSRPTQITRSPAPRIDSRGRSMCRAWRSIRCG